MRIRCYNVATINIVILLSFLSVLLFSKPSESAQKYIPTTRQSKPSALSPKDIAKKVNNALVVITTQGINGEDMALGSGFFIDENTIATNLHIFKKAVKASVRVLNSEQIIAIEDVVSIDIDHDVCLFTLQNYKSKPLKVANIDAVEIGDDVFVGGNPKGLEGTFSRGIVSSIRKDKDLIQIDAAISSGSSGGPVVNSKAEVIGIATSTLPGGQNLNFVVPISYVNNMPITGDIRILYAGALSISDKENMDLSGPVKILTIMKEMDIGNGKVINDKSIYTFFRKGSIESVESFTGSSLLFKMIRKYNSAGFITSTDSTYSGKTETKYYDGTEALNFILRNSKHLSGLQLSGPMSYNETKDNQGNIKSDTINSGGYEFVSNYTYNNDNSVSSVSKYIDGKFNESCDYYYKHDGYGNWVQQIEACNGNKTRNKINRVIVYH